ncbi:MAG: hypothetical protein IKT16_00190 [Desulfovibrio sp.]|nr:hypothetical protein [Desulfovibrio sp.]
MKQNRTKKKAGSGANPLAFDGITREELQARLNGASLVAIWILREMGLDAYRLFDLYFGPGGAMRYNSLGRRMQATMPFLALLAVHEWLCSEVRKSVKGVEQLLSPLALADASLPLTAEGRDYVRRLAGTSTSLYEIRAVEEQRVLVASLLDESAEPEWIARLAAKPDVAKGDVAGLRLLEGDGLREAALGVYSFERRHVPDLAARIRKGLHDAHASGMAASMAGSMTSIWIARAWVDLYLV